MKHSCLSSIRPATNVAEVINETSMIIGTSTESLEDDYSTVRSKRVGGDDKPIVFIKTHKTGSSTMTSILQRYGYTRNLTFLVPNEGSLISYADKFKASKVDPRWRQTMGYRLLTNHARYDRVELSTIFPDAYFITIIRNPASQLESAFYYFDISDTIPPSKSSDNPLEYFMRDPMKNYVNLLSKDLYLKHSMHNHQLFDFGVDIADMYLQNVVDDKIAEIDANFDLVMICEYFDESLLLLKKLFNWKIEDVVYLLKGRRAQKYRHGEMSDALRAKIRSWNAGDAKLYEHFNQTLWRKIKAYGPSFDTDLATLREKLSSVSEECLEKARTPTHIREEQPSLKRSAPAFCKDMNRLDYDFTELIRSRMHQLGLPQYSFTERFPHRKATARQPTRIVRPISIKKRTYTRV
ncbi:galactosylceramide sulfotransferase-like [Diadema setosum]|uniref:galactosylceramide sulfotransferase-like n=1 Tax=Diadema setosum TaxID=31175 RepID=UPI003B3A4B13